MVSVDVFLKSARIAVEKGLIGLVVFSEMDKALHEVMKQLIPVIEAAYNEKPETLDGEFKVGDNGTVVFVPTKEGEQNGS